MYSIAFYFFHRDAQSAHDVTQQVFLKLIDNIARFRGDSSFSTWLYRLVVNACLDRMRRRRPEEPAEHAVLSNRRFAGLGQNANDTARPFTRGENDGTTTRLAPRGCGAW